MRFERVAVALTVLMIVYSFSNVIRAVADPVAFADNYGIPLDDDGDREFVDVYAIRTAVVTAFAAVLLWRRDRATLMWFAGLATLLPVGDLVLVTTAGAPAVTIARHVAALVVLATLTAMFWWLSRSDEPDRTVGHPFNAER